MPRSFLSPRNDAVFKRLFGDIRDTGPLADFLGSALDLPPEEFLNIELIDPHLNGDELDDKQGILDIRARTASGKMIDIEIQLVEQPQMRERIVFYLSRMVTAQIARGKDYSEIKRSICVLITDYVQIPENDRYHNRYRLYDPDSGSELTRLLEIDTLELAKLPHNSDGTQLWNWLRFLIAEEDEMESLAEKNPQIGRAMARLAELSEDEREYLLAESREKMRRDNAARLNAATQKGLEEGLQKGREETLLTVARSLLGFGRPVEEIAQATGLSSESISRLLKSGDSAS